MATTTHSFFPLLRLRSPAEMLEGEWTFLAGEMLMHALVCWLAWWVFSQGKAGGRGLAAATVVACFTGGALIELATVMVPQIGNFYHAQAAVQLFGLREPLYMLVGCYTWIPATALLLARTLRLPSLLAEACLAGLLAHFSWGVLDTVGLKFLWWTWHIDEPLYADRIDGVPAASSFWILASACSLSLVVGWLARKGFFSARSSPLVSLLVAAIAGPAATLGLMQVPFNLLYHPLVTFGGHNAVTALNFLRIICAFPVLAAISDMEVSWRWRGLLNHLFLQMALYMLAVLAIAHSADPSLVFRSSFGQPLGPCGQPETSFWGAFNRSKYVCPQSLDPHRDHFAISPSSASPLASPTDWYTIVGVPRQDGWLAV